MAAGYIHDHVRARGGLIATICVVCFSIGWLVGALAKIQDRLETCEAQLASASADTATPAVVAPISEAPALPWRLRLDADQTLAVEPLVGGGPSQIYSPLSLTPLTQIRVALYHRGGLRGEFLRLDLEQRQVQIQTRPPAGWSLAARPQ